MSALTLTASAAIDAVVLAAHLLTPVREAGVNAGRFVEAIQRSTGNRPPDRWCASFVAYVGRGMLGARWPLPGSASCDVLLEAARAKGWLVDGPPRRGDLFLRLRAPHDADHTGFVLTPPDARGTWRTVEGNTGERGGRDGDGVYARVRGGTGDPARYVFVRWARAVDPSL